MPEIAWDLRSVTALAVLVIVIQWQLVVSVWELVSSRGIGASSKAASSL
jgi:hypothetical protein